MSLDKKVKYKLEIKESDSECKSLILSLKKTLEIISGKWKILILTSLLFDTKRFKQISNDLDGISDKMLAKELQELVTNNLVNRIVYDTFPPTVEYSITEYGKTFENIIRKLGNWSLKIK